MEAESLRNGFRLGDWLIEPAQSRASTTDRVVELDRDPLRLLLVLVARPGEAVDRRTLRTAVWPDERVNDERLRETVAALRAALGENARHPRYIASVGSEGYALIGHLQPVSPGLQDAPGAAVESGLPQATGRLHSLLGELRRRQVFKVAASYLVGMWIVLQVAQVTFAPLRFPDWWMTALTILAVIGLPIVVVLAWTYEITPQGIMVDAGADGTGVARRLPRARQSIAPFIVAGVALMAVVTGFAWWRSLDVDATATAPGTPAPEPGARSVAVLPLVDMSAEGGNSYLGDGLSEELSTRLAQVPGLRVAARTSAFEFKGRNLDVRKIGQSLGVRHVLEGSVRRHKDNVRVTVQLIDAATGYHVWAGNFDRPWRDVLELQDDIAMSVTDALQLVFRESPAGSDPERRHAVDAQAIDPYLAGLAALRQPGDLSRLQQAKVSFRQAIEIDAEFAGAYAGLCRTHAREFERTRDPLSRDAAQDVCRKALALDPDLVETRKALAITAMVAGGYETAKAIYSSLVERNPQDADAYVGLGDALAGLGEGAGAEAYYRRAVAVEPAYWGAHAALATHLFARGKVDESIAEWRKVTELVPSSATAWSNLGGTLNMKGDFGSALEAYDKSLQARALEGRVLEPGDRLLLPRALSGSRRQLRARRAARRARLRDPGQPGGRAVADRRPARGRGGPLSPRHRAGRDGTRSQAVRLGPAGATAAISTAGSAMRNARGRTWTKRWLAARRSSTCITSPPLPHSTAATGRPRCAPSPNSSAWATRRCCCVPHRSSAVCGRIPDTRKSSAPADAVEVHKGGSNMECHDKCRSAVATLAATLALAGCAAQDTTTVKYNDKTVLFQVVQIKDAAGVCLLPMVVPNGGNLDVTLQVPLPGDKPDNRIVWEADSAFAIWFAGLGEPGQDPPDSPGLGDEKKDAWNDSRDKQGRQALDLKLKTGRGNETVIAKYTVKMPGCRDEYDPVFIVRR